MLQCDGKSKLNSWDRAGSKQIRAPVSSLCLSNKFINNRAGPDCALIRNPNLKCSPVIRLSTESTTRKNLGIKIERGSSCYMLLFLFLPSPPHSPAHNVCESPSAACTPTWNGIITCVIWLIKCRPLWGSKSISPSSFQLYLSCNAIQPQPQQDFTEHFYWSASVWLVCTGTGTVNPPDIQSVR